MEVIQSSNLGEKISNWYVKNGRRNLPWRNNISPYRVWISEIMLQQTQVNTAIAYFERFMAKYPDLQTIKKASEDDKKFLSEQEAIEPSESQVNQ